MSPLFRTSCFIAIKHWRRPFAKNQITRYRWENFGIDPESSKRLIVESTPLASIRIRKSYFLAFPSIASEKALMNPAIGAFILSS